MLELSYQKIDRQLNRWDNRLRQQNALVWAPRGLLAGLLIGVALAALSRFYPLLTAQEILWVTGAAAAAGMLGAVAWVVVQPRSRDQKARFADRQFGLRERLITAVQLRDATIDAPEPLRIQQVQNAADVLDEVDTVTGMPLELNAQDGAFILLALALLAAAMILPNPQERVLLQERAVVQAITEQISEIEAIQQQIQDNPELTPEQAAQLQTPLDEALTALEGGDLSQEEALAALSEAQSELRALEGQTDQSGLQEGLGEAGSSLSGSSGTESLGEAMGQQDLAATAEELRDLVSQLPALTLEEQQEIGRRLSEAAQQLQEINPELAQQLGEAGTSLQQGEVDAAQQALEAAAEQLEQAAGQQALSEAAGQAAEQLQESRSEVAQAGQPQTGQPGEESQTGVTEGQSAQPGQTGQTGEAGEESQTGGSSQAGQSGSTGELGSESGQGGVGGTGEGPGSAAQVFVPPFRDLSEFEGVEVELPAECIASPADCGELLGQSPTDITEENSLVPYEQVYSEYANTAYEALEEDYVPLGMKSYIRDYFTSLEPGE